MIEWGFYMAAVAFIAWVVYQRYQERKQVREFRREMDKELRELDD